MDDGADPPNVIGADFSRGRGQLLPSEAEVVHPARPRTQMEQLVRTEEITWTLIDWLQKAITDPEGEDANRWKAVKFLREYLAMTIDWMGLLRDLTKESQEYQELLDVQKAVIDVMATQSPAVKAQFAKRLSELHQQAVGGVESAPNVPTPAPSRRRRGRPRKGN